MLTKGERLWIWLRRNQKSHSEFAEDLGVSPNLITAWVRDREDGPDLYIGELTLGEVLSLARRRQSWTLEEAAHHLGVSKRTLIKRESGGGEVASSLQWWRDNHPEVLQAIGYRI